MNTLLKMTRGGFAATSLCAGTFMRWALLGLLLGFLVPWPGRAEELRLLSVALRGSVSAETVLGADAPETFREYSAALNCGLPWERYSASGWGVGTRLIAGAGALHGGGKTALVISLIPGFALVSQDGRYSLDMGFGGALLSRHHFGTQNYGGPFQFALTAGAGFPLYQRLGAGYRFLHYSDAGLNGANTTGADLHMLEFTWRF